MKTAKTPKFAENAKQVLDCPVLAIRIFAMLKGLSLVTVADLGGLAV